MELPEARWKFLIDAVEATIGQDGDDIARAEIRGDSIDDCACVGQQFCFWSDGARLGIEGVNDIFRMKALGIGNALLLIDAGQYNIIGEAQACDQIGLQHLAPQRV